MTAKLALQKLSAFLNRTQAYWKPSPFVHRRLLWEAQGLGEALDRLSSSQEIENWLQTGPLAEITAEARQLSIVPSCPSKPLKLGPTPRVPGRKREQIERFIACLFPVLSPVSTPFRLVDWCAGKSHLGRLLAENLSKPLLAVELQSKLCEQGLKECQLRKIEAEFDCTDVLTSPPALRPDDFLIALHACGELHVACIQAALRHRVLGLAFSPCCYNRQNVIEQKPLSQAGLQNFVPFTESDLDFIHREPDVASEHDRRLSERDRIWRLGFDLWQRTASGQDQYRSMPPFPHAWLQGSFTEFCFRFAELDGLNCENWPDPAPFEAQGEQRFLQVSRREQIRAIFRKPLELWLFFDRVCWLEEEGYRVQWGEFCPCNVTPRNLICIATREDTAQTCSP